jgi:hypothetical protein
MSAPHRVASTLVLLALAISPHARADEPAAAAPALQLADLAYSLELTPAAPRPLHTALVPLAVYRGVVSPELDDLRVFDATGRQLSHAVRVLDESREVELGEQSLPMFPLYPDPARPERELDALSLTVQRDAHGTVIAILPDAHVRATGPARAPAQDPPQAPPLALPIAYVLDASRLEHPIVALRVELPADTKDYVLPVLVEASDDLGSFHTVAIGQPLVRLDYGGARIAQNRVALPQVQARYLRVRFPGQELPAPVTAVIAEHGQRVEEGERATTRIRGSARKKDPSTYDFDLGGPVPIDGVRVVLPEDDSLIEVELASYAKGEAPRELWRGTVYRVLHDSARLETPSIDIPRRADRYYRMRVARKGGGLGGGTPELELRYRPHQLLFVGRGKAPYHLAYGHYGAQPSSFAPSELLALLPVAERESLPASDCTLGAQRTRAGEAALTPPPPPPPLKRYALWGVLIAATAALGIAAIRIGRGMG